MKASEIDEQDCGRELLAFALGQHRVAIRIEPDQTLSLWLDGCLRKQRGEGGTAAYLWTNVELPFEDHHLVQVYRSDAHPGQVRVTVNGAPLAPDAVLDRRPGPDGQETP